MKGQLNQPGGLQGFVSLGRTRAISDSLVVSNRGIVVHSSFLQGDRRSLVEVQPMHADTDLLHPCDSTNLFRPSSRPLKLSRQASIPWSPTSQPADINFRMLPAIIFGRVARRPTLRCAKRAVFPSWIVFEGDYEE